MNLSEIVRARHSCKAFDATRRISAADWEHLKALLINAPSSVNSQPWRFVIAQSDAGRARVLKGMTAPYFAGNAAKVKNASHTVVLCARKNLDAARLNAVLEAEDQAGRFASPDAKAAQEQGRGFFVNVHREKGDEAEWLARQVYIALGSLLLGAATLGIDACPMEGFDAEALDRELGLNETGHTALAVVALGYRAQDDFNATLPKSRLPEASVLVEI
ncbi:MAG: oxygen-insensitive NAD(P)H nitroreductase [Betaproteobacteria bacterium]|nr:oxygen-insensitive NAD(P)H nitroreductase [Betaproteobacteria bacterium]